METRGAPKTSLYWGDLFHTLVNVSFFVRGSVVTAIIALSNQSKLPSRHKELHFPS